MFKKLALGCLVVVAITGIALFITWRQATRLPDWYVDSPAKLAPGTPEGVDAEPRASSSRGSTSSPPSTRPAVGTARGEPSRAPAPPQPATLPASGTGVLRPGRVELSEPELNRLLLQSLDEHPRGQRLKRAVKGVHASIDSDRLEIGVVTNLADLGAAAESEREAKAVRRLTKLAPWLGDRDVYLAVRGRPQVRDGRLVLGRDGELKVGAFTFDVAEFAGRLGVPDEKLDRGVELPLAGMTVEDVEVTGGSLILSLAEDR